MKNTDLHPILDHGQKYFFTRLRWLQKRRGFLLRALLCWVFSLFFLKFDERGNYDLRFRLRPPQKASNQIVLVTLKNSDFAKIYDLKTSSLINLNEMSDFNDSFYWERTVWLDLLSFILDQNPKSIGVTLYFGPNVGDIRLTSQEILRFKDPKVFWATISSEAEKLSLPFTARHDRSNIGHLDFIRDDDGTARRISTATKNISSLAEKLAGKKLKETEDYPTINYKGSNLFQEVSWTQIATGQIPKDFFKNKIVVIGAEKNINSQILTPLGLMSRHEFVGQKIENIITQSFIKTVPTWIYAAFLLFLTFTSVLLLTRYPQTIAFFFFVWLALLTSAFSTWIFDTFYVWVPIISSISLLIFVWVLFIGHQALVFEQAHLKLKQEQSYLAELEQLKNNFVSLISHDLKTPIAKIQGVLDRLMTQKNLTQELTTDLSNLKEYSEELNKYIQSILKVLRVESRDFKLLKETADINGIIENAIERLAPLAHSKKLNLETNLEPMFLIEIDVTLMTEVIMNILENAIKYTPENGSVLIKSYETNTDVCVEISDNGEGISKEDQEEIWKKFVRGRSQDHRTKGTGLGLYLVKYFIELHGGQINFTSEINKGTTFYIKLPLDIPQSDTSEQEDL